MWTDVTALASGLYVDWRYGFSFRVICGLKLRL